MVARVSKLPPGRRRPDAFSLSGKIIGWLVENGAVMTLCNLRSLLPHPEPIADGKSKGTQKETFLDGNPPSLGPGAGPCRKHFDPPWARRRPIEACLCNSLGSHFVLFYLICLFLEVVSRRVFDKIVPWAAGGLRSGTRHALLFLHQI